MPSTEICDCDLYDFHLQLERQNGHRNLLHLLIGFLPFGLAAQVISSSVVGDAQDASGAAVPGAAVVITNISTGATRTSNTDEAGGYVFPQLPPGDYSLSATHTGFKRYEVSKINLPVNQTVRVDIRLVVGEVSEQVQVTAQAVQLESETSSLGQVVSTANIVELPLNGRNFMQLANISPGVVAGLQRAECDHHQSIRTQRHGGAYFRRTRRHKQLHDRWCRDPQFLVQLPECFAVRRCHSGIQDRP